MSINIEGVFAKAEMLIRKPVSIVFEALVNPDITTRFWFTKSSGKLEPGKQVTWTWEMYDHSETVSVKTVEPNEKIVVEWGTGEDRTMIEWAFTTFGEDSTFVSVINGPFRGETEKIVSLVRDATEGFALMLAGLKAWLEHTIQLNLVGDRFPNGLEE